MKSHRFPSPFPQSNNTFIFLRHGETEHNRDGICMGQLDSPLTEAGLKAAKGIVITESPVALYFSPLQRAAKTAEIIATQLPGITGIEDSRLAERHGGITQGVAFETIAEQFGNIYHSIEGDLDATVRRKPAYGESELDVALRLSSFLIDCQRKYSNSEILVVGHSGTVTAARYLWGLTFDEIYNTPIPNCTLESYSF